MKLHTAFFLCAGLLAAQPALADAGHDHAGHEHGGHDHGPKYGGIVREMHGMAFELVAKPDSLIVHVSDHDKPVPTQGIQAEAVIYASNGKTHLKLQPTGGNRLEAKGNFKVGVGVRVALSVTLPGQVPAKVTYGLK